MDDEQPMTQAEFDYNKRAFLVYKNALHKVLSHALQMAFQTTKDGKTYYVVKLSDLETFINGPKR